MKHLWFGCGCLAALAACDGTMQGIVRGEGTPIQFQYEQGLDRDFYTTTLDGETFTGLAANTGRTSSTGTVFAGGQVGTVLSSSSTGEYTAVLFGDQGSTLRCDMNYIDPDGFTTFGGVGLCRHSDGRVIDVTW